MRRNIFVSLLLLIGASACADLPIHHGATNQSEGPEELTTHSDAATDEGGGILVYNGDPDFLVDICCGRQQLVVNLPPGGRHDYRTDEKAVTLTAIFTTAAIGPDGKKQRVVVDKQEMLFFAPPVSVAPPPADGSSRKRYTDTIKAAAEKKERPGKIDQVWVVRAKVDDPPATATKTPGF